MKQRTHTLIAVLFGVGTACTVLASEPITAQTVVKAIGLAAAVVIAKLMPGRAGDDDDTDVATGTITGTIAKKQP